MKKSILFVCTCLFAFSVAAQEILLKQTFQELYRVSASTELRRTLELTTGNAELLKPRGNLGEIGPALRLTNWKPSMALRYEPVSGGSLECFGKDGLIAENFPALASGSFTVKFQFCFDWIIMPYQGLDNMFHALFSFSDKSRTSALELTGFQVSRGKAKIVYRVKSQCLNGPEIPFRKWIPVRITYTPSKVVLSVDGKDYGELNADGRSKTGGFIFGCGSPADSEFKIARYHYYMKDFQIERIKE